MTKQASDPDFNISCSGVLSGRSRQRYLQRVEDALNIIGSALEERNNRRVFQHTDFIEAYLEGRCWLLCELRALGSTNETFLLACLNTKPTILEDVGPHGEGSDNARHFHRCNEKPMLIDIAQLVHGPDGVPLAAFVCLHVINKEVLDGFRAVSKDAFGSLPFEAVGIICERESDIIGLTQYWREYCYGDVIKGAAQVPDSIADDGIEHLSRLMEGLKNQFVLTGGFISLGAESVKISREIGGCSSFEVLNVIACSV